MSTLVVEREISNSDEKKECKHRLVDDISEVYDDLALVNHSQAKWYTDAYLEDDVKDLLKSYEEEISHLPDDNPVKIECLNIMAYIGIEIAKPKTDHEERQIEELEDGELLECA
jgi:hypothetical protein